MDEIATLHHRFYVGCYGTPNPRKHKWFAYQESKSTGRVLGEWRATSRKHAREMIEKLARNQRVLDSRKP